MSEAFSYLNPITSSSEFNQFQFAMRRYMAKVRTVQLAKVISCTNHGDLSPVGTLTIQMLINQTDSAGNTTPFPQTYRVPYIRIQGGANAVIIDPEPGDIGMVVFGDRDLSAVIASKAQAAPGSNRRFSLSDALWVGGMLNGTPTQYVQFNSDGINVTSPNNVTIKAPNIKLDGVVEITGATTLDSTAHVKGAQTNDSTITASGEVKSGSHTLTQHTHISSSPGTPTSTPSN